MMTDGTRVEQIEQRIKAAAEGPWTVNPQNGDAEPMIEAEPDGCPVALMLNDGGDEGMLPNADLIANAPSDLAWACETIRRLTAERDAAQLQVSMRDGTLAMTVARLGGRVEGRPTARVNFLQRVDELREIEAAREADRRKLEAGLAACDRLDVAPDGLEFIKGGAWAAQQIRKALAD